MSDCLLWEGSIGKGCCRCRPSTSPHFFSVGAFIHISGAWKTIYRSTGKKAKEEATPPHVFIPCTTPLSILTAQWHTPCFTGQMLNECMFFFFKTLPSNDTYTTELLHLKDLKCIHLNPVYVVFWFSRWISCSSNRKWSLLKVKHVNVHWLWRKCIICAASSVWCRWPLQWHLRMCCSSMQPLLVSKATTSMKSVTPWARMCSTLSRRTTVWADSVVAPCAPSPSTSSIISDKRSSLSPGHLSACLASSLVVYKRWVKPLLETLALCPWNYSVRRWVLFTTSVIVHTWCCLVVHVPLQRNFLWGYDYKSHSVLPQSLTQLEVQAPPGNTVGYVVQQWHPFSPKFIVANEHSEPVLKIHGPFCGWSCLPDVDFEVGLSKHRNPLNLRKHNTTR